MGYRKMKEKGVYMEYTDLHEMQKELTKCAKIIEKLSKVKELFECDKITAQELADQISVEKLSWDSIFYEYIQWR